MLAGHEPREDVAEGGEGRQVHRAPLHQFRDPDDRLRSRVRKVVGVPEGCGCRYLQGLTIYQQHDYAALFKSESGGGRSTNKLQPHDFTISNSKQKSGVPYMKVGTYSRR